MKELEYNIEEGVINSIHGLEYVDDKFFIETGRKAQFDIEVVASKEKPNC